MQIGKNWFIESDELNVTLYKKQGGKAKRQWKAVGYYSTIKNALKALVDLEVKETGLKDLKTIVEKQDELYQLIETIKNKE